MAVSPHEPERLATARSFWERSARDDARLAIWWNAAMLDPATKDAEFERAGEEDSRRVAWFGHRDATVVDLGCGIGRVIKRLAPYCREVIGVDIAAEMLEQARTYLRGLPNVRLVRTDGASLAALPDASVDLLYTLLVLIHVDKRTAFQYLREIRRVLRPGGIALLQVQDILTPQGMKKFEGVLGTDYPLEFYAPEEARAKLAAVGLSVLGEEHSGEYLFVTALHGDPGAWRASFARDVTVDGLAFTGGLAGDRWDLAAPGDVDVRLRNRGAAGRRVWLTASLVPAGSGPLDDGWWRAEALLDLPGDAATALALLYDPDSRCARFSARGLAMPRAAHGGRSGTRGAATLHLAALPPGHLWCPATLSAFPGLVLSRPVEVA